MFLVAGLPFQALALIFYAVFDLGVRTKYLKISLSFNFLYIIGYLAPLSNYAYFILFQPSDEGCLTLPDVSENGWLWLLEGTRGSHNIRICA